LSLCEATKALEFLGVVKSKPGRGLSVGRMNLDWVTEYLEFRPYVMRRMQQDPGIYEVLSRNQRRSASRPRAETLG